MRTRLLLVLAILGAIVVAGFAVPLALASADLRTRQFVLSKDGDLQRFGDLADSYVRNSGTGLLLEEIAAYNGLYGDAVAVVSTRGASPRADGTTLDDPEVSAAVGRALRNERSSGLDLLTPWSPPTAVFAKPIGTGAQVNGAVVIVASTQSPRNDILQAWLLIGIGALAAVACFGVLALALSRWVLRPLEKVSHRMQELTGSLPFAHALTSTSDEPAHLPDTAESGPPEFRQLSKAFERMVTTVHTSAEAQSRLIADTAHQLRNPITALQLRLDLLEPHVQTEGTKSYRRAVGEALRLEEILDDLLALSVAETPRVPQASTESCLPYMVALDRADTWAETAAASDMTIKVQDGPAEDPASINTGGLEQALDVLLDNACKYAGPGSTVRIFVDSLHPAGTAGGLVDVTVTDDGAGVLPSELKLITRRFFRGTVTSASPENGKAPSGTGLGLSIVEALIERSGGRVTGRETPGGGLTIVLSIPSARGGMAR
ncbi:HAMP domain-containing sensor histidine kinase [Arthrobacter sp. ISL-28]|uniref:sensor histidine kinase n=1 Tax=Arthrobacter sp. ISL-28 TaxID=2819108 RepID=UPI001BE55771|nr:HAMP domain-containing sensor histidine kinase [Arthrobacter sp. ISL-28]MBT2523252.1 HAMP domain-containing histidine kinase [Arthrobacter sp. ISL-28]